MIDLGPILSRHGLTLADMLGNPTSGTSAARTRVLRDLVAEGYTAAAIGEALGVDRRNISARCRLVGIDLPRRGRRRGWSGAKRPQPQASTPQPEPEPVRLRLVPPLHAWASGVRRADCASLTACEEAWIQGEIARTGTTGGQAWCPRRCDGYEARG
jgi:hypothetical protein